MRWVDKCLHVCAKRVRCPLAFINSFVSPAEEGGRGGELAFYVGTNQCGNNFRGYSIFLLSSWKRD